MVLSLFPNVGIQASGTAFPVPQGATGPVPVLNRAGNRTGIAFTGGSGGAHGQVDTIRMMHPTAARGRSPGYPHGDITYQNAGKQGVNPSTGRTGPRDETHFPLD